MFQRARPDRCMNIETHRPDFTENIPSSLRLPGKLWRLWHPVYVDCKGVMTTLDGNNLDVAIRNKIIVTADEWRAANRTPPDGELYVDYVSGLPPVDPKTGELVSTTGPIAKSKITCGEWIRIKYFMKHHGKTVFIETFNNKPTQRIGTALFDALARGLVVGVHQKVLARDILARKSEPNLREATGMSNQLFFTPPVPRKKIEIDLTSSSDNNELSNQELLDLLATIPQSLPDNPFNFLDESVDEIFGFKPNTFS